LSETARQTIGLRSSIRRKSPEKKKKHIWKGKKKRGGEGKSKDVAREKKGKNLKENKKEISGKSSTLVLHFASQGRRTRN